MAESEPLEVQIKTKPAVDETKGLRRALYTLAAIVLFVAGCYTANLYCQCREPPIVVEPEPKPEPKPILPWRRTP